ncbi:MAG: NDP-sugar synthase, partial [bacterium]|nr:NDP-sugar synthase [bacterium]
MKALIMAGGLGTRLRPLTINLPKPMVPVVNKPMMGHIIDLLKKHNIKEMTSILYFQPEIIKNYFGDGSAFDIRMDYVDAVEDFGTAGSIKNAEPGIKETFLVISGDVLTDFDLTAALKFHREKKALATMVLTRVTNPLAYGVVITDKDGKIERFLEKPVWGEVFSDTVNTGIYILEPKIFEFIPAKKEFDFSRNLFPHLLEGKQPLYGYIADGYWKDIGDLAEYRFAHQDILTGKVKVGIPGNKLNTIGRDIWIGEDSEIDKQAELNGGVVIGKNCLIKANAQITNAVIGDNTQVEEGAKIHNSIIWENSRIGRQAELKDNIICH